jgi:hypothetical protein
LVITVLINAVELKVDAVMNISRASEQENPGASAAPCCPSLRLARNPEQVR